NEGIPGRKKFKRRTRQELDHIIALTQRTKETLILEGADPQKITVISHGINTRNFKPHVTFGTTKKKIHILFAGRLEVYKGIYEVLYAAKKLLTDKDLKKYFLIFSFVGNGSQMKRMIEMEHKLGIEKFIVHRQVSYDKMPD